MNIELLKSKMDTFFSEVSPDQLVKKFEKLGYTFENCEVPWVDIPTYITETAVIGCPKKSLLERLLGKKQKNKLTSDFSEVFFLSNLAICLKKLKRPLSLL